MANKTGKYAVGALLAAVAGYVAGVLTAPKSGKETRQDIKEAAIKARLQAEKKLKSAHTELHSLINTGQEKLAKVSGQTKTGLMDALEQGKQIKDRAKELLSAIHEGESDDKDLQQAIQEADKAIEHLRKYVTKETKRGSAKR